MPTKTKAKKKHKEKLIVEVAHNRTGLKLGYLKSAYSKSSTPVISLTRNIEYAKGFDSIEALEDDVNLVMSTNPDYLCTYVSQYKYTVEKILYNKLSANHIPYYLGMIVKNSVDGSMIYVDEFNTEKWLRYTTGKPMLPDFTGNIMAKITLGQNIFMCNLKYNTEEERIKLITDKFHCLMKLIRNDNKALNERVIKKISL